MTSTVLSIVVPVFNLAADPEHLETELSKLDRRDVQIIIVDDGSTDGTAEVLNDLKTAWDDILVLTCRNNKGAGVARNLGFSHTTGKYTLFFDSDDYLHPDEIYQTIETLEEHGADASINSYEFIRDGSGVSTGMNMTDREIWKSYAHQLFGRSFSIVEYPEFLRFTNFPWNKLIRTSHYRSLDLSPFFGETKVNNDILGHWNTLLNAKSLIVVDQEMVTHRMSGERDHLSKRFGRERLEVFNALETLHETLQAHPGGLPEYAAIYWRFAQQITDWAESRLDTQFRGTFDALRRKLVRRVSISEISDIMETGEHGTYRWLLNSMD